MARAGNHRLQALVTAVNFVWGVWALLGGVFFLRARELFGSDTTFSLFHAYLHGYELVGVTLLICGVVSLLSACFHVLQKLAALLCFAWCFAMAVLLQITAPGTGQGIIDAWLLLMCAFTCAMRWALLVLEPYVCE